MKILNYRFENGLTVFPNELTQIKDCVEFWNKEGEKCHINNDPNYIKGSSYEDFILGCIAADCMVFCNSNDKVNEGKPYITGKGGSHVWIARKSDNERIIILFMDGETT